MRPPEPGGTELVQAERLSELLVPFTGAVIERTRDSFQALNQALGRHVESR